MARLYVVPTPIGNLEDITLRGLRVLREVSLILAEDTRQSRKLLTRYGITTPMLSYHEHNKLMRLDRVMEALERGDVALISDAGMPAVSDPGFELIRSALELGVSVDVLPGASAVVTAVVAAAIPAPGFLFGGFLPRQRAERQDRLREIADVPYSLVLYEAPHRLLATLHDALEILGDRPMVTARELTKVHQEVMRASVAEQIEHFRTVAPRGEITLVLAGAQAGADDRTDEALAELRRLHAAGEDRRSAVRAVTERFGIRRNDAYRLWLEVIGTRG